MAKIKETPIQGRRRVERERRARWAAEEAAKAKEEAQAAAPTALPAPETSPPLPAPETSLQSMSAVADANGQGEEENALVMTSREIKEMRRAEKARRKEKKSKKGGGEKTKRKDKKRKRYVPRSYNIYDLIDCACCRQAR